jgi:hypothetical protein
MNLLSDRDLLLVEPSVFLDAQDIATILLSGVDAAVGGTSLTAMSVDFSALDITSNHVIVIDSLPAEIIERIDAHNLTISRPRASTDDPLIPLPLAPSQPFSIGTFDRQSAFVEGWALGALGLNPVDSAQTPNLSAVLSPDDLKRLLVVRAIAAILAAASTRDISNEALSARADLYAEQSRQLIHGVKIELDLNGDGVADACRWLDVLTLMRS